MKNYEIAKCKLDTENITYQELGNNQLKIGNITIKLDGDFIDIYKGKKNKWVMNALFDEHSFLADISEYVWLIPHTAVS